MIRTVCKIIFKLSGWTFVNEVPKDIRSYVMIGAPHTSNHDFVPAMVVSSGVGPNAKFVIKDSWLKGPVGLVLKHAGAIGIDRKLIKEKGTASTTDAMAQLFKDIPELILMIAPEGTRKANENWKTGFYYIAQKANVPLVMGFCDYGNKRAGVSMVLWPTDFESDMKKISDFYRNIKGAVPENFKLDKRFA